MNAAELQQAISLLRSNYLNPEALNETELNRATLEGLMQRVGRGVVLMANGKSDAPGTATPFYGEIIEGHIGYLRLGALNRGNLQAMDSQLQTFASKKVDAVVVDLRASIASADFAAASDFAQRFCPKGKILFTLRKPTVKQEKTFTSERDPSYQGLVLVLADGDTSGAAEALAGVLHLYNKALIIGQSTAGRAVEYSDLPLASGKVLRVAVGEAVLPEGRPIFPEGVKPDLAVEMAPAEKREVFQQSLSKGMGPFVFEAERPHLNEAALLAGKNPEIEAMEVSQQHRARPPESARDIVLQRALDLITSLAVYQGR
ncbi:MAG: carboxyl-terminal processing protease [Verrucomicrobiota bacterium]